MMRFRVEAIINPVWKPTIADQFVTTNRGEAAARPADKAIASVCLGRCRCPAGWRCLLPGCG
jgi:hypothetical protein